MFFIESSHSGSEDPLEFLKNRKAGAQETAKKAKEKGGDAMLSYYHFAAKTNHTQKLSELLKTKVSKPQLNYAKKNTKD